MESGNLQLLLKDAIEIHFLSLTVNGEGKGYRHDSSPGDKADLDVSFQQKSAAVSEDVETLLLQFFSGLA